MSAVETYRVADRDGWQVRVVENKFPALSREGDRVRRIDGVYRSMSGVGFHEVVVEHRRHDLSPALYSVEDLSRILVAYKERYRQIRKDTRVEAIIIFKNHGESAGTSLAHPHSQIAATPIVPTQVRHRLDEAIRFFDETGECVFCTTLRREVADRIRIVASTDSFVAFIPFAALSPFHLWIFPVRHCSSFDEIEEYEITDLAVTLRTVLGKLYYGLNDPDYNFSIRSIPAREGEREYFHWYLTVIPRIVRTAGFEIGSGMYINTSLPEESARFLRGVQIQ
jgi:UDPglucose--hexose-1-phosphate uridylyltransferase